DLAAETVAHDSSDGGRQPDHRHDPLPLSARRGPPGCGHRPWRPGRPWHQGAQLMAVHLVCEGGNTGLDNRTLDRLVVQFYNLSVQMAPSGGSGGLGAVRVYLLNRSANDVAISVEDRDYFRTRAEAHAGWGNLAANGYIWRRHEIENYLLHPRVVL